jgi:hypothetical protein
MVSVRDALGFLGKALFAGFGIASGGITALFTGITLAGIAAAETIYGAYKKDWKKIANGMSDMMLLGFNYVLPGAGKYMSRVLRYGSRLTVGAWQYLYRNIGSILYAAKYGALTGYAAYSTP